MGPARGPKLSRKRWAAAEMCPDSLLGRDKVGKTLPVRAFPVRSYLQRPARGHAVVRPLLENTLRSMQCAVVRFESRAMIGVTAMGRVTGFVVRQIVHVRRQASTKKHHPGQRQTDDGGQSFGTESVHSLDRDTK